MKSERVTSALNKNKSLRMLNDGKSRQSKIHQNMHARNDSGVSETRFEPTSRLVKWPNARRMTKSFSSKPEVFQGLRLPMTGPGGDSPIRPAIGVGKMKGRKSVNRTLLMPSSQVMPPPKYNRVMSTEKIKASLQVEPE